MFAKSSEITWRSTGTTNTVDAGYGEDYRVRAGRAQGVRMFALRAKP